MYYIIDKLLDEDFWLSVVGVLMGLFIGAIIILFLVTATGQFTYYGDVNGLVTDKRHERICEDGSCRDSYYISIDKVEYLGYEELYKDIDTGQKIKCEVFGWDIDWVQKNLRNCKYD